MTEQEAADRAARETRRWWDQTKAKGLRLDQWFIEHWRKFPFSRPKDIDQ